MLKKLSMSAKLVLGFAFVNALCVGLGLYSVRTLGRVYAIASGLGSNSLPSVYDTELLNFHTTDFRQFEFQHVSTEDPARMKYWEDKMAEKLKLIESIRKNYEPLIDDGKERTTYAEFGKLWDAYLQTHEKVIGLSRQNKSKEALGELNGEALRLFDDLGDRAETLAKLNSDAATEAVAEGKRTYGAAERNVWLVIVFSLLSGATLAWVLIRGVKATIQDVLTGIMNGTERMLTVVQSLDSASGQLSASTQEESASIQETAATVEEISAMAAKNAEGSKACQETADRSRQATERGKEAIDGLIRAVGEIQESQTQISSEVEGSNRQMTAVVQVIANIGEKTKVINDIVFQTKLLSFNASVEAARAGEHGKGFAVVAEEIGSLAQMSGKASTEIAMMLGESIKQVESVVAEMKTKIERQIEAGKAKVDTGTRIAHDCKSVLDEVLEAVRSVNERVSEIAVASGEQTHGVTEINKAITELNTVTHQNSNLAQNVAAGAQDLTQQTEELRALVRRTFEGSDAPAASASVEAEAPRFAAATPARPVAAVSARASAPVASPRAAAARPGAATPARAKPRVVASSTKVGAENVPNPNDPRFEDVG